MAPAAVLPLPGVRAPQVYDRVDATSAHEPGHRPWHERIRPAAAPARPFWTAACGSTSRSYRSGPASRSTSGFGGLAHIGVLGRGEDEAARREPGNEAARRSARGRRRRRRHRTGSQETTAMSTGQHRPGPLRSRPAVLPLHGRVAVVTGAARGVGAALAAELSKAGVRVALLGREEERLGDAAAGLPAPTLCVEADVTDPDALVAAAREVETRLGPADVVVANAGIAVSGPFRDTPADLWQRVVDVNLTGAANTARAFLAHLSRTGGYFLQVASTAAFGSAPMMSAYCASKAGAESFAQALRCELEADGIAVGIAYLHWTGTDMVGGMDDNPVLRSLRAHQPSFARRVQSPQRVAGLLTAGIARRASRIYAPPWLRWCQPLRPLFPALVAHVSRRELGHRSGTDFTGGAEVLGAGGLADWNARRSTARPRPDGRTD